MHRLATRVAAHRPRPLLLLHAGSPRGAVGLAVPLGAALGAAAGLAFPLGRKILRGENHHHQKQYVDPSVNLPESEAGIHLARQLLKLEDAARRGNAAAADHDAVAAAWARVDEELANALSSGSSSSSSSSSSGSGSSTGSSGDDDTLAAATKTRRQNRRRRGKDGIGGSSSSSSSSSDTVASLVQSMRSAGYDAQKSLVDRASEAGVPPGALALQVLVHRHQLEGRNPDELEALIEGMSTKAGVRPNEATRRLLARSPEEVDCFRLVTLKNFTTRSTRVLLPPLLVPLDEDDVYVPARSHSLPDEEEAEANLRAAWLLFERVLASRQATTKHVALMVRDACLDSTAQLELVQRAASVGGLTPCVRTYTTILHLAHLEGSASVDALTADMARRGVAADEVFEVLCQRPAEEICALRTSTLKRLLTSGENGRRHQEIAWRLFDGLVAAGEALHYQLCVMLSYGTSSSAEMREVIDRVEEAQAGLTMRTGVYNALLSRLNIEGRDQGKMKEVLDEMETKGLRPDRHTSRIIEQRPDQLSAMRTRELKRRLERGRRGDARETQLAWQLFSQLYESGCVDAFQINTMRRSARWLERAAADEGADFAPFPDWRPHLERFLEAEAMLREHGSGASASHMDDAHGISYVDEERPHEQQRSRAY